MKSSYQIKEGQVKFLLEKNWKEFKEYKTYNLSINIDEQIIKFKDQLKDE